MLLVGMGPGSKVAGCEGFHYFEPCWFFSFILN